MAGATDSVLLCMEHLLAASERGEVLPLAQVQACQQSLIALKTHLAQTGALAQELQEAQQRLQAQEKMAALGRLMASVAHEINTPVAAIKSSGRSMEDELHNALQNMPVVFELLDTEQRRCFMQLVALAMQQASLLSSREERTLVAGLVDQLERAGVPNPRHKATILVQMGAQDHLMTFVPLLQHPRIPFILGVAHSLAMLGGNARNINDAATRVARLAAALKSYSHPGAKQEMVEADLQDELENVLTLYQGRIKSGTELVCHFARVAPISCFPEQLNQVWVNLIHNALQAMEERGTLTVSLERIADEAVVSISDTGCGIAPENRERIFDPFYTTKAVGVGTGLGLDIVKRIIETHHGHIVLESEVGHGSTFRVYLPYVSAVSAAAAVAPA